MPASELAEQFSRSPGPGGQSVNTADSRVQLSLDLASSSALDEAQRHRILTRLASRLTGTVLTVSASEHRSQLDNRIAARRRIVMLLREGVAPAAVRRSTRPTRGSQRRRIEAKIRRSQTKQQRRPPRPE